MDMRMADVTKGAFEEARDIVRGSTVTHGLLRNRIVGIGIATAIVDVIGTLLIYMFEHNAKGTEISTMGDSLFWVSCQLLTVSSQVANPFTTGGRIVDVLLELYAITVVTTLAGSWGAFFHQRSKERRAAMHQPAPGDR